MLAELPTALGYKEKNYLADSWNVPPEITESTDTTVVLIMIGQN